MATIQRIIARTHPVLKKGYAQIEVIGTDLPGDGMSLSLFRSDRKEFLGSQDRGAPAVDPDQSAKYAWQTDEGALAPVEVSGGGERLFITLGKNVVVHMDQQSIYSVSIRQNGVTVGPDRAVPWRDVAPVDPKERGDILSKAALQTAPPPPPPPVKVVEASPVPVPEKKEETQPPPEPEVKTSPRWLIPALGALALLVVAGGVWYVLSQDRPENAPVTAEAPAAAAPAAPVEPGLDSYLSRPPEEIVAEAQRRRDKSRIDEALFLLRAAGDKGYAEAQRQMAQIHDPTNLTPGRTTQHAQPDVEKAYGYYRQAIGKGSEAARADLARLRVTVERGAAQGDAAAARLLQRWAE